MTRFYTFRRYLLAPLIYLAALLLLCEEWLWHTGDRAMQLLARLPPLHALEHAIRALPPYCALAAFVLPALLLFPVKLLALLAIAHGHAWSGVAVIVLAKLGGAAAVARIYALTRPALLTLGWFARWHGKFIAVKDRWIARLQATPAWLRLRALSVRLRALRQNCWASLRARRAAARQTGPAQPAWRNTGAAARDKSGLGAAQPARVLRRFVALWRARRR